MIRMCCDLITTGEDQVLIITRTGEYYMTSFDAANHYDDNILRIEKFRPNHVWTAILNDADQGYPYIKRFTFEPSTLILLTDTAGARFVVTFGGNDSFREALTVDAAEFIGVKSFKAKGKRLTTFAIDSVEEIEPNAEVAEEEVEAENAEPEAEEPEETVEPEVSDDELRDEINGQQRIF